MRRSGYARHASHGRRGRPSPRASDRCGAGRAVLDSAAGVLIAGFPAGPWGTNCYVAATGPGSECVVIDPGKDAADGVGRGRPRAPAQAGRRPRHPRPHRPHVVRRPGRRDVRRHRVDPPRRPAPARQPDGRDVPRDQPDAARRRLPVRRARRRPELAGPAGARARRPALRRRPHPGPHRGLGHVPLAVRRATTSPR